MFSASFLLLSLLVAPPSDDAPPVDSKSLAIAAGDWLLSVSRRTDAGLAWSADPAATSPPSADLYSGSAGVVLFLFELTAATKEPRFKDAATSGARELAAAAAKLRAAPDADCGLYSGLSGIAFVLGVAADAAGDEALRSEQLACIRSIREHARAAPRGVEWSKCTDVIAGSAGIGLFLLDVADDPKLSADERDRCRTTAAAAGLRLLDLAERSEAVAGGRWWRMEPDFPRVMPNFAHGTAGVACFLAELDRATRDSKDLGNRDFLAAATAGAEHLLAIADTTNGGCRIHHDTPDGKDLYYLGWCHGPAGTARLFDALAAATGDAKWTDAAERCAVAVRASGAPEQHSPGFWENVSYCCGTASLGEFALERASVAHGIARDPDLAFAERCAAELARLATKDEHGARWIQAEHRVKPELKIAQTGLMQGAAGVGRMLLHLESARAGTFAWSRLPDVPRRVRNRWR